MVLRRLIPCRVLSWKGWPVVTQGISLNLSFEQIYFSKWRAQRGIVARISVDQLTRVYCGFTNSLRSMWQRRAGWVFAMGCGDKVHSMMMIMMSTPRLDKYSLIYRPCRLVQSIYQRSSPASHSMTSPVTKTLAWQKFPSRRIHTIHRTSTSSMALMIIGSSVDNTLFAPWIQKMGLYIQLRTVLGLKTKQLIPFPFDQSTLGL